jgi:hypothetical protein
VDKTGRNAPCPCGSGKKYKHCHGSVAANRPRPLLIGAGVGSRQTTQFTWGFPAQNLHVAFVPQYRERKEDEHPQGLPGRYNVIFVFSRPGFSLTAEREYKSAEELQGDSHLAITPPAYSPSGITNPLSVIFRTSFGEAQLKLTGVPNDRGFLGKVFSESFDANSFSDAEERAYRALAPALSNLSIHLDIPLSVHQVESRESSSGSVRYSLLSPYFDAPFAMVPIQWMESEFRGYASLYREALNSNSGVYTFLCFFKIIEAVRERRSRLGSAAKKAGIPFSRPAENIPANPEELRLWLSALFPVRPNWTLEALDAALPIEARGKRIGHIVGEILNPLRDNIAHALLSAAGTITVSADELLHIREVGRWLPLTKFIARRMLKNEFPAEFLCHLSEDGTVFPK